MSTTRFRSGSTLALAVALLAGVAADAASIDPNPVGQTPSKNTPSRQSGSRPGPQSSPPAPPPAQQSDPAPAPPQPNAVPSRDEPAIGIGLEMDGSWNVPIYNSQSKVTPEIMEFARASGLSEETVVSLPSVGIDDLVDQTTALAEQRLGPMWKCGRGPVQMRSFRSDGTMAAIGVRGPRFAAASSGTARPPNPIPVVIASFQEAANRNLARSATDPVEAKLATDRADAAKAKAEAAAQDARYTQVVLSVREASPSKLASSLKVAFPWAAFAVVGPKQLLISAPKEQANAAMELGHQLDDTLARDADKGEEALYRPMNLVFPGGTVSEYLAVLGKAAGTECWYLDGDAVGAAIMPNVKLSSVTPDSAIRLLDGMQVPAGAKGGTVKLAIHQVSSGPIAAPPIYRIQAIPMGDGPHANAPRADAHTQVFSVDPILAEGDAADNQRIKSRHDALLAAIEAGLSLQGDPKTAPKIKLHAPSGMLFVHGTPAELNLVQEIMQKWAEHG